VVTIDQNRWSRSVKFTGHDLLEWVVTVDQNTHSLPSLVQKNGNVKHKTSKKRNTYRI
jgi:hypothetical protein